MTIAIKQANKQIPKNSIQGDYKILILTGDIRLTNILEWYRKITCRTIGGWKSDRGDKEHRIINHTVGFNCGKGCYTGPTFLGPIFRRA